MRRRKWLVLAVLLPVLLIGGIVGGVAAAADDTADQSQTETQNRCQELLERACEIYEENTGVAIDPEQLQEALSQARDEMRDEAMEAWLQQLVDDGTITQEEADQYLEWWQARPDIELPGPEGHGPRAGMRGDRGMMRGGSFHGWGGSPWCTPDDTADEGDTAAA